MAAKTNSGTTWSFDAAKKTVTGGNGIDNIDASAVVNSNSWTIAGGNGDDIVKGSQYDDVIWGDSLNNSSTGDNGADKLYGGAGKDQIHGGNGADRLQGDAGADQLWGDRGGDIFKYVATSDSAASSTGAFDSATGDVINDFKASEGDKLDLSELPLDGAGHPDKLTWSGNSSQAYGVWSDGTKVYADTNGDGTADVAIKVQGVGGGDFIGLNHNPLDGDEAAAQTAKDDSIAVTGNVLANASDADNDSLKVVEGSGAGTAHVLAHGTLTLYQNGDYSYVVTDESLKPGVSYAPDSFTYTVSDGHGGTNQSTLSINLAGLNDAPKGAATATLADGSEDADYSVSAADLLAGFSDVDGDTLSVANLHTDHGAVVDNGDGTFKITPELNYNGAVTLTYDVSDGTASVAGTQTFNLAAVNDAPTGAATATLADGSEDADYTVSAADLLAGFSDVDGDTLSVANLHTDHGAVVDNGDGTFKITPELNYNGAVTLTYDVSDGTASVAGTQTFNLAAVNDPALISGDIGGSVTEDTSPSTTGNLDATDVDNPADSWTASSGGTTHGSYSINAAGEWSYSLDVADSAVNTLNNGDTLPDSFTVHTDDGTAQIVTITINGHSDGTTLSAVIAATGDPNDFDASGLPASGNPASFSSSTGNDTIYGGAGNDTINGNSGNDVIYAGSGNDSANGNNDQDALYGGSGNDALVGGGGNDMLVGGWGADILTGLGSADTFKFLDVEDRGDNITDFAAGTDKIDLSAIDATPGGGEDAFAWGGTTATAHGVWYALVDATTTKFTVYADTDGDVSTAELWFTADTITSLASTDFLL